MTEILKAMFNLKSDQSANVTVNVCSTTGAIFRETFPVNQITLGHVKYLAIEFLLEKCQMEQAANYRLISVRSKRTIDEGKTLKEETVKHGDEYLLVRKLSNELVVAEQTSETCSVDENSIKLRTEKLPQPVNPSRQAHHLATNRADFRSNLNRIFLALIETSHKLLWYRSDAEQIFRHVEKFLSQASTPSDEVKVNPAHVSKLIDIGFTEQQARFALKRTKSDLSAAMEFLLTEPTIEEENEIEKETSTSSYSHRGPFIPFRQFRQKYCQPNPNTIRSLADMGFNREEIIHALQACRNNQQRACDYLLGDKKQQQAITDAANAQSLDPDSHLFKALMGNPVVQQAVNDPRIFFALLHLYEDPMSGAMHVNEQKIAYLILELSRVYYTERSEMDRLNSNQNDNHDQETSVTRVLNDDESDEN